MTVDTQTRKRATITWGNKTLAQLPPADPDYPRAELLKCEVA